MTTVEKKSILPDAIRSAITIGFSLIIYNVLLYVMNVNPLETINSIIIVLIQIVLITVGLVIGTKNYRDKTLEGYISYSHTLGFGVLTCIFAGILLAIYTFIFNNYIDPQYYINLMEQSKDMLAEKFTKMGMTETQIEEALTNFENNYNNPNHFKTFFMGILGTAFTGLIISLITSAFLKKKGNTFEQTFSEINSDSGFNK